MALALSSDVLVVASPTYEATYTGLLKAYFDRFGSGALASVVAIPLMLGGAPVHTLAVDCHLHPLLLEIGRAARRAACSSWSLSWSSWTPSSKPGAPRISRFSPL